jgi:phytoene dehydrogenase-like protein
VDAVPERLFNYSGAFAPPGRTVVQVMADTTWDHWASRAKDRPAYDAEKARVASALLGRLEAHRAGISADVEMTDVATPHTTWRYTLNHQGAWGGWLPPAKDMLKSLPRRLPGLRGFYMAGQWSTPGGSALGSMWSGRQAVQVLMHDAR